MKQKTKRLKRTGRGEKREREIGKVTKKERSQTIYEREKERESVEIDQTKEQRHARRGRSVGGGGKPWSRR